jgi:hypothetical protein
MEITIEELNRLIGYHRQGDGYGTIINLNGNGHSFRSLRIHLDRESEVITFNLNVDGRVEGETKIPLDELFTLFPLIHKALEAKK